MEKAKKLKFFVFCLGISCLIGNFIHFYWLADRYFRYEISSSVEVGVPYRTTPPSVSIRAKIHNLLLWESISKERRKTIVTCNDLIGNYHPDYPCGEGR